MKKFKLLALTIVLILGLSLSLSSLSYAFPSQRDLNRASVEILQKVVREDGPLMEVKRNSDLGKVFHALVKQTKRKDIKYKINVIENKKINAFALPNGQIIIYRGLLKALPKGHVSPIAFIVAHEMSHIELKHARRKISNALWTNLAITVLTQNSNRTAKLVGDLTGAILVSGYSRSMETDADRKALTLMRKAKFNPKAGLTVMKTLQKIEKKQAIRVFPTHPKPEDRYKNIVKWLKEEKLLYNGPQSLKPGSSQQPSPSPSTHPSPSPSPSPGGIFAPE